jgi:hypothetical protein
MNSPTHMNLQAREGQSVGEVRVDEESVEIFLPETERRRVVIATLDEQGRPKIVWSSSG